MVSNQTADLDLGRISLTAVELARKNSNSSCYGLCALEVPCFQEPGVSKAPNFILK